MHASHAFLSSSFSVILAVCAVECNSHFLVAAREVQAPLVTFGRMPFEKFKLFGAAVARSVLEKDKRDAKSKVSKGEANDFPSIPGQKGEFLPRRQQQRERSTVG